MIHVTPRQTPRGVLPFSYRSTVKDPPYFSHTFATTTFPRTLLLRERDRTPTSYPHTTTSRTHLQTVKEQDILSLYRAHSRRLYNLGLRLLGNAEDAEEVTQDTILRWVDFSEGNPSEAGGMVPAQISTWLSRTCIRLSLDRLRSRRRYGEIFLSVGDDLPDIDDGEEAEALARAEDTLEEASRVREALSRLKDPYRPVLTLILLEGLDYEEVSSCTGIPQSTLRSHYMRGKAKLLALLGGKTKKESNAAH